MPSQLQIIAADAVKVRWKEPYASEALNRKFTGVITPGIYRGLVLAPSVSDLSVSVEPDSVTGEHIAVVETVEGFSLSVRDASSGAITLDLDPLKPASGLETVVVAVVANYTVGIDTTAEYRGYTLAEYDALSQAEQDAIVVLGTALVPPSGVIDPSNITSDRRSTTWTRRSSQQVPWNPLLRNVSFEASETGGTYRYASDFWETSVPSGSATWATVDTDSASGAKSIELDVGGAGTITAWFLQHQWMPVVPGQKMRVRLVKKCVQATPTGTGVVRLRYKDKDGVALGVTDLAVDMSAVDADFVTIESTVSVPAGAYVFQQTALILSSVNYAVGPALRVDEFQVWLEADAEEWLPLESRRGGEVAAMTFFIEPLEWSREFSSDAAYLRYYETNPAGIGKVILGRKKQESGDQPPALELTGRVINLGEDIVQANMAPLVPRIQGILSGDSPWTQTHAWTRSGNSAVRHYVGRDGLMHMTTWNAGWIIPSGPLSPASHWAKDVAGEKASRLIVDGSGKAALQFQVDPGTDTFSEAGWISRTIADQHGFRTGRVSEIRQEWIVASPSSLPDGWTSSFTGVASTTAISESPVLHSQSLRLYTTNTSSSVQANTIDHVLYGSDDSVSVVECEVYANSYVGMVGQVGINSFFTLGSQGLGALFVSRDDLGGTWHVNAYAFPVGGGSTGGYADTGVPLVADQVYRLRLEVHGQNMPGGPAAYFYIDGDLMSFDLGGSIGVVSAWPLAGLVHYNNARIVTSLISGTSDDRFFYIGPILAVRNRVRSDDLI